jgi:L-ascorbate metabolism protein UlaG (beta-lactamase superfamily)
VVSRSPTDDRADDPWRHHDGRRFRNPDAPAGRSLRDLLRWQLTSRRTPWPRSVETPGRIAGSNALPPVEPGRVAITFIHHATFLIRSHDTTLVTDPVWARRVGPWGLFGPRRVREPAIPFRELPPIHAALVSHNHYDHMDLAALGPLTRSGATVVTPLENGRYLGWRGIRPAVELDWWESCRLGAAELTLVPAQHWSNRALIARNAALWGGFVVRLEGRTIYFTGDTGYWQRLWDELRARFAPIDLALLPIGAYEPRWFMREMHMNPDDSARALLALQARRALGMHYGSWRLTDEGIDDPLNALAAARVRHAIDAERFSAALPGVTTLL